MYERALAVNPSHARSLFQLARESERQLVDERRQQQQREEAHEREMAAVQVRMSHSSAGEDVS
jgi:hypothetical protein